MTKLRQKNSFQNMRITFSFNKRLQVCFFKKFIYGSPSPEKSAVCAQTAWQRNPACCFGPTPKPFKRIMKTASHFIRDFLNACWADLVYKYSLKWLIARMFHSTLLWLRIFCLYYPCGHLPARQFLCNYLINYYKCWHLTKKASWHT